MLGGIACRRASTSPTALPSRVFGLTIPAVALASIWLHGSLVLGLTTTQITLLVLTAGVGSLTILPGRATLQEGGLHLVIFGAFLLLAVNP